MLRRINKKALSEMVSYVLLISIAVALAVIVFSWIKVTVSDVQPNADCKEGTSMTISKYECFEGGMDEAGHMYITLKNNGRFNITGFILTISSQENQPPTIKLITDDLNLTNFKGNYYFSYALEPGEERTINFSNKYSNGTLIGFNYVRIVQVQPIVLYKEGSKQNRLVCQNTVIKQNLENCMINNLPI